MANINYMALFNFKKSFSTRSFLFSCFLILNLISRAQLSLEKIFSYALDGNMPEVLKGIEIDPSQHLSAKDSTIKIKFEERFKYSTDKSNYLSSRKSAIDSLLFIYHNYWRLSLLNPSKNYDVLLKGELVKFLSAKNKPAKKLTSKSNDDDLSAELKKYISSAGLHTTGYGNTGKLKDLLVWTTEKDTTYNFEINGEKISARVFLMDKFITLGWEEYATLDKLYPGGWATHDALYCVEKAYDLKSENFLISYLAHEGRHFADYKLFPELMSTDLEYRAKLTELSMANETLFTTIQVFIINANYESDNDHQVANYCVIRDLSKLLFKTEFEKDLAKWKTLSVETIHTAAIQALNSNTGDLKKAGKGVKKFIKK